ncbi:MAG: hypothetical protein GTO30_03775, partial [Acidobacteria bacterium]|nr:hypothetical protein [Acidobacteriota bacterium]NIM60783.1 hypothetical protein [Acidobacteriota bacterium]NIQ83468.1 hypothetical protein [Acidobacteriota bacterium]NIT09709.1 hypothetical protein [Acidobacteriota bacterium]
MALSTAQQEYQLLLAETIAREVDIHVDGLRAELLRVSQTLGGAIRRTGGPNADLRRDLAAVVDERMPYLRYDEARGGRRSIVTGELAAEIKPSFDGSLEEATKVLSDGSRSRPDTTIVSQPILAGAPPRAHLVISAPVLSRGKLRGVLSSLVDLEH